MDVGAQEPSLKQIKSEWTAAAKELKKAGDLFRSGDYETCRVSVEDVIRQVAKIPAHSDPEATKMQAKVRKGIERARTLLREQGIEVAATGEPGTDAIVKSAPGVSFVRDVAPIIMRKCGRCHIDNTKGDVSLVSFAEITKPYGNGQSNVVPQDPAGSYFYTVIESGDMPKGPNKISPEELATLRNWIEEGAHFDGADPTAPLDSLSASS